MMGNSSVVPPAWPQKAPVVVFVNVALEGWTDDSAPGIGPMGNPLRPGVLDTQAQSWAEYGPRVGMDRILEVLDRYQIRATVFTSGIIADRYPALVQRIADAGHDLCAHSWAQNIIPVYLPEAEERENIARTRQAIAAASGTPPVGWCSPRGTPSPHTFPLLVQQGFQWHMDAFDREVPYWQPAGGGQLLAIPFTMEINDMPLYVRYGNPPGAYYETFRRMIGGWYQYHREPCTFDVTIHAHVFGRPFGLAEFSQVLDDLRRIEWITLCTHAEVAAWYQAAKVR